MILHRFLPILLVFYRQILLAWGQQLFLADALAHAPNHLLVKLNDLLDFDPIEQACASYHHQDGPGCTPTYSIAMLVRSILVGWLYGLSLRGLEERLHCDLVARWFIGCPCGEPTPDHTTLGRFEVWLVHNQPDLYFGTFLSQIEQYFPQERQAIQIGDTYAMRANAADETLVRRIRHLCLRLTMELQDSFPSQCETLLQGFDWCALYGAKPETPSNLLDRPSREQRLERTALAAIDFRQRLANLLATYDHKQYLLLRSWCAFLDKVLADELQVQRDATGQPVKITELPKKDKGNFRLISATDPEATLRVHGEEKQDITLGYNIQLSVTPPGFIHETKAYTGATSDQSGVAALISEQKQRTEACDPPHPLPPKLIYDKAAGSGKTRAEVHAASDGLTLLVARPMPYDLHSVRFSPYDFSLFLDGNLLTCPFGKSSSLAYPSGSGDGREFIFSACLCWLNAQPPSRRQSPDLSLRCPLWEKCRGSYGTSGSRRQVFISDYRDQVLAAEAYCHSPVFQLDMKQRPLVERIIFELSHYNNARRCRRQGLPGADFQAKMCASAYNLKLLVRILCRTTPRRNPSPLAG